MSESFDQARRYGSRWHLVELVIGVVFIVGGLVLFAYADWASALPLALVAIGVFEIFSSRIKKFFWLRKHGRSKAANQKIEMSFDDEGFETKSSYSHARMTWNGVEKCVRTPKGILLWPQKGVYIYISEEAAGADAIAFIESKVV
ncbi:MAG: YcxB family protein [Pseudomonadota bacterium]